MVPDRTHKYVRIFCLVEKETIGLNNNKEVSNPMAKITLHQGDIAGIEADAIVNAANNHLWMGSGVAGAIKQMGGVEIERDAVSKGPISIGEAVATTAGKLKARYVIHAAVMGQDRHTDGQKIRTATRSSLQLANDLGLKTIAFPALGTGVGGFPVGECAEVMLSETATQLKAGSTLEEVKFVLYGPDAYRAFEIELKRLPPDSHEV